MKRPKTKQAIAPTIVTVRGLDGLYFTRGRVPGGYVVRRLGAVRADDQIVAIDRVGTVKDHELLERYSGISRDAAVKAYVHCMENRNYDRLDLGARNKVTRFRKGLY